MRSVRVPSLSLASVCGNDASGRYDANVSTESFCSNSISFALHQMRTKRAELVANANFKSAAVSLHDFVVSFARADTHRPPSCSHCPRKQFQTSVATCRDHFRRNDVAHNDEAIFFHFFFV